jgi:cytochrome P450
MPLPPGPRIPSLLQTIGWWSRPTAFLERCRARYGRRFTVRLTGQSPFVVLSDPDELKQILTAPPDVLHPGEGAHILEPIVGPNSVILLDEDPHMRQRKLLLGPFHGERMQRLAEIMGLLTDTELEGWPLERPFALHPRFQRLTLEIILRTVFGLERGAQLDALRELLAELLSFGDSPISLLPPVQRLLGAHGPLAGFERAKARADELIFALIDEHRASGEEGDDVLSLLLSARHEDGSPMSRDELRDELMTALVAGHETTASQLAWGVSMLARSPAVQARLHGELDAGSADAYLTATIQEIMRRKPVLPNAEPRLVVKPIEVGGITYEPGVVLFASAYLVQHDPSIYDEPYAFRPERFLERPPGTYTWIPFGGGRRRCIGASFALLEMKIVLRALARRFDVRPAVQLPEAARRRGISISPARRSVVVLSQRSATAAQTSPREAPAAAVA